MLVFLISVGFIVLAAGLAWFLLSRDQGEKEPIGTLWLAAGFGLAAGIAAAFLEAHFINAKRLFPGTTYGALLSATMTIGVIEESCKFLPLAFFIYKKRYFNEHTDGVIYFALAGLGFGLPENVLYTMQFGAKTGLARLLMTPVFHAATTGLVGYWLVRFKLSGRSPLWAALPLLCAILVHGFYDFGLLSGSVLFIDASVAVVLSVSIGLFAAYLSATDKDREQGLSAVGDNSFCRSCGYANPHHYLYCVRCGKYA